MIKIRFFTLLHLLLNQKEMELPHEQGETVRGLLYRIQNKIDTPFLHKLIDDNGEMHAGTIIMINGSHIFHLQKLDTLVPEGAEVALFPPCGGG